MTLTLRPSEGFVVREISTGRWSAALLESVFIVFIVKGYTKPWPHSRPPTPTHSHLLSPTPTYSHPLSSTATHSNPVPLIFNPLPPISNPFRPTPTHVYPTLTHFKPTPTHVRSLSPIIYYSNPYLVPVSYVSTCFTYLCAYAPSRFTCPCNYVIHFYKLYHLCLYTSSTFVCGNTSGLFTYAAFIQFCVYTKDNKQQRLFIISAHYENHIKHLSLTRFNLHSEWYHIQYDDKIYTLGIVN